MEPFATLDDYEARYGAPSDQNRVETLLGDASAFIASQCGFEMPDDDVGEANLVRVTCAVVDRSLSAGSWAGLSNVSQSGDGYSASATVYNPSGDFYLTKAEKQSLGLCGTRVGSMRPLVNGWYGTNVPDAS